MKFVVVKRLALIISLLPLTGKCQKLSCDEIIKLMMFEEIKNNLGLEGRSENFLFIDKDQKISNNCSEMSWYDNKIRIIQDSALASKVKIGGSSSVLFAGKCDYMAFTNYKLKNGKHHFTVIKLCSNQFVDCIVKLKKRKKRLIYLYGGTW